MNKITTKQHNQITLDELLSKPGKMIFKSHEDRIIVLVPEPVDFIITSVEVTYKEKS